MLMQGETSGPSSLWLLVDQYCLHLKTLMEDLPFLKKHCAFWRNMVSSTRNIRVFGIYFPIVCMSVIDDDTKIKNQLGFCWIAILLLLVIKLVFQGSFLVQYKNMSVPYYIFFFFCYTTVTNIYVVIP